MEPTPDMQTNRKTILLVEDEVIQAMMGKTALEKYGYAVLTAISGEKAVTAVEAIPEIDLILMDIDLGSGIDGTQAAEQILARHDIPIVFLSSHLEPDIVAKTENITSYGYVVKNTSSTVIDASIKMAFKLFDAKTNERRKELILQQAGRKYADLFNSMTEGFAVHEIICDDRGKPVDYRFLDINPAFERLTGLAAKDILGKNVLSVMPGTEPVWLERYGHVAMTGETLKFEEYSSALGRYFQVISFSPEKNKFAVIFSDITERKLAELRLRTKNEEYETLNEELQAQNEELRLADLTLRESEEHYKSLFDNNHAVMLLMDHRTGVIADANPAACEYYGYSLEAFRKLRISDINTLSPAEIMAEMERARTSEKNSFIFRHRLAGGEIRDVEVFSGAITVKSKELLYSMVFDITDRIRAEEKLQAKTRYLETILKTTPDGFWIVDADKRLVEANDAYCRMSGYSREELLRLQVGDLEALEKPVETEGRMQRILQTGSDVFETRHRRKDGTLIDIEMSTTRIDMEGGLVACFCRDISGRSGEKRGTGGCRREESPK